MATDPYLTGAYTPVYTEHTEFSLPVEGTLPEALDGLFTYIGPNPIVPPTGYRARHYAWFRQDGFVSGVRLRGGRAHWFRNRWIRSRRVCREMGEPRPAGPRHFLSDVVHTNVVCHGDLLLALVETGCVPVRLSSTLETVAYTDLDSALPHGVSAHPKLDPNTGELVIVAHTPLHTWGEYLVIDKQGRVRRCERVDLAGRPLIHDIALTDRHVILFDLPVRFKPSVAVRGQLPYRWDRRHQARIGVFPRDLGPAAIRWFDIAACFVLHTVTAAAAGDRITVRAIRYERMFDHSDDPLAGGGGQLWEWEIDLAAGTTRERQLDDRMQELPRLDPRTVAGPSRYYYAVSGSVEAIADRQPTDLLKHDLLTGTTAIRDYGGSGGVPSEAVFVPRGTAEDDGWLLHLLYDLERDVSKLVVLDSHDFDGAPTAVIDLPCRVPSGFHASWIEGTAIEAVDAALAQASK
ncbi:carotenoid oxygenase family protein [Nocardia goodfellowii]|uniref:Dioxygenase n=1 Tax=Nocardia goodfellowii TaxID=882446 RepID=A0ABS4QKG3_9NOCA|nr:carotenoid oxygenase family protein [Nocardia goodfellowii]MBP2191573.1 carotenoid cleavage dioxygenase [Nocardia goodfellowii]